MKKIASVKMPQYYHNSMQPNTLGVNPMEDDEYLAECPQCKQKFYTTPREEIVCPYCHCDSCYFLDEEAP
jgi:hypothetical protein